MSSHVPDRLLPRNSRMKLNVVALAQRDHSTSFKKAVLKELGDLSDFLVLGSNVLVATYIQTEKTPGGIIVPNNSVHEDRWQGKANLVLKLGETAFKYDGPYEYKGTIPKPGDYVMFHTSDGRELGIRGTSCRLVDSSLIKMITPDPDELY